MAYRVQYLSDARLAETLVDTRAAKPGRVWVTIGKPTDHRAKAEKLMRNYRIDAPDAIVRIRESGR